MAEKINVESGNPYRDQSGHFGTSPDDKLKASIAALRAKKLVSHEENKKKVSAAKSDAKAKLAALRGDSNVTPGSIISSPGDIGDHILKIVKMDPANLSKEDKDYLKSIKEEAQKAIDEDRFEGGDKVRLGTLYINADWVLQQAGDESSVEKIVKKTKPKVPKKDTPPTDNGNWKPSGTEAEAKEFSKNSSFKGTLYHGTTQTAASSIEKKGFDKTKKSKRGENNFPGAVMFTTSEKEAAWYGKRAGGDDGVVRPYSVVSTKINTAKHKVFTDKSWDKFESNKTTEEAIKEIFKDYDSFEIKDSFGNSNVLVKDHKQIMVFNNDKR